MSKAAELAALIGSQSSLSNRNLIINGAMQVAQRGTSFTNATSYTLDRWLVGSFSGSGGDVDVEQGTFTPAQGYPERFINYLQYTVNTMPSSPNEPNLQNRIEDCLTANGETVTLSFWAKVTSGTATIDTNLLNNNGGSGGNTTTASHSLTTTWTKFTQTVTLPEVTSGTTGSTTYVRLNFSIPQGTSNGTVYQITGVQLEVGEQATPFEHRSYGDELARCRRYCNVIAPNVAYAHYGFVGFCESSTKAKVLYTFPMEMRATPSFTRSGSFVYDGASANPIFSSVDNIALTPTNCRIEDVVSSGTTGQGVILINDNDASATIKFDAEL